LSLEDLILLEESFRSAKALRRH